MLFDCHINIFIFTRQILELRHGFIFSLGHLGVWYKPRYEPAPTITGDEYIQRKRENFEL